MPETKSPSTPQPEINDLPDRRKEVVVPNSDEVAKERAEKNMRREELLQEQRRIESELEMEYQRHYGNLLNHADRKKKPN